MKRSALVFMGFAYLCAASIGARAAAPAAHSVAVNVAPQPRQTFGGLGTSAWGGDDYMQLTPERRAKLNELVWRDARFNTVRLWLHLKAYAPAQGERKFADALPDADATLLHDALAAGAKHIVLGPCDLPPYLLQHFPGENGKNGPPHLKPEQIVEHAAMIADFIRDLRDKDGIAVEATGVQNEPNDINDCQFTPGEMVQDVKLLRAALDARGLKQIKIVAPETVGASGTWHWTGGKVKLVDQNTPQNAGDGLAYAMVDALKTDKDAWAALGGVATHSYDGGADKRIADAVMGTGKDYWMTEYSIPGPENPGDYFRGAVEATTFLCDMNHWVSYWVHFIGYLSDDPHDDGTRLMAYYDGNVPDDKWLKVFEPYAYLRQLGRVFDPGAVFRQSTNSVDGDMVWGRDHIPTLAAAVARNPDGSWAIGITNYTSDHFPKNDWFEQSIGGKPAQTLQVTVKMPELAGAGDLPFLVERYGPDNKSANGESATLHGGELTVTVHPLELITLQSQPSK